MMSMQERMAKAKADKAAVKDFFIGLALCVVGFVMLTSKIVVSSGFSMGYRLYHHAGMFGTGFNLSITTGMVFIPMIIGIMWLFAKPESIWGWTLAGLSFLAMIFGVIASLKITMLPISTLMLVIMLVIAFGGLGMLLKGIWGLYHSPESVDN